MSVRSARIWIEAARPKTLGAGIVPVVMATAMAFRAGSVDGLSAFCALLGAMLIQIGTNLANDYADFVKGADTSDRVGPVRATQAGLVSPRAMRRAAALVFFLACVPGAYIVWRGGWPFAVIGIVSILCGALYTAGPFPLGYIGLADVFVLVFFGPVALAGTYWLHVQHVSGAAVVAGLAPGLLSVALLTVNNLRDIEEDRRSGKRSLAVRFGAGFARGEYGVCIFTAAFLVPMYLAWSTGNHGAFLASVAALALGIRPVRVVLMGAAGRDLNLVLAQTGRLLWAYGAAFSAGWLL